MPSGKIPKKPPTNAKRIFFEKTKTRKIPKRRSKTTFKKSKNKFHHLFSRMFFMRYSRWNKKSKK